VSCVSSRLAEISASLRQVPGVGAETAIKAGETLTISEIKGGRCSAEGYGWVDLADLKWKVETTSAGFDAKFLKICGRKKRALVLDQGGMPWVWSESLEGILKVS
jgi:hypothetical protein